MIELTPAQRRELRARAHHLSPVVTIAGNGLAPNVVAEIERSLQAHELIKVRIQGTERDQRDALMLELCNTLGAAPVQHIGNILVVWRERKTEEKKVAQAAPAKRAAGAATAKSAAAFAAAARRAALMKASAEKRRAATPRPGGRGKPAVGRGR
ncbi:YhbY family RNA-binding protein [Parazoarcus communis]|uniref:Ribosome assembly RNA-binding protein YhbY n=1 Tax=Parazoarcus communis SWub3 = DSM 12120 TaxID=1121029 RepID=A0A323V0N0_9RHOO|nr:YhbY family RNA-binding protein [Parazoarcus communis]NMG69018.1 ribosome assembly RNA-binding protein YhbY [Parazoarcus communis SWub3 = DSM 12120]PZA16996.1 ribosome assembly RNA-binding protein YhbY [Azoarcus communis] [Parazoarcus communis SWub3 = DSM 12120]